MIKLLLLATVLPGFSIFMLTVLAAAETLPSLSTLIVPTIVITILVLLNGFFVAAEFAIIGVRSTQMEQMAMQGNSTAASILSILESRQEQDKYIATAQLGITIASLGLAYYGEPAIAHFIEPYLVEWFGMSETAVARIGYFIALGLLTYLHVVIGEMVPKTLALSDARQLVLWLNWPMRLMQSILKYPVLILNGIGNFLLRVFKVPPAQGHARVLSAEEIELIVAESAEEGLLKEEEEEMILNIFDFGDRVVEQVMTPRPKVEAIPHDISREDLLKLVIESRHSRFPVYEGDRDHIIGVLHIKDLMRQHLNSPNSFDLRLLSRSVPSVPEDKPVEQLLVAFKRSRLHMAIVLDEFGGMAGIVTLEDLVEEIVGEVRDEFDLEKEPLEKLSPGVLEVSASYLVDDLIEDVYLGEEKNLPDVETVGGLVVSQLGRLPQVGDEVIYNGNVHLKVLAVDKRAVLRVRLEYPVPNRDEQEETSRNLEE